MSLAHYGCTDEVLPEVEKKVGGRGAYKEQRNIDVRPRERMKE